MIQQVDWKWMEKNPKGDPDFSPEHNKRVIAEVERENDLQDKIKDHRYSQQIKERSEAAARYLKNVAQGEGITDVKKYFGKRYLAYLRGQEIVKTLQNKIKDNPALMKKLKTRTKKFGMPV